jgi:hypothetical protein
MESCYGYLLLPTERLLVQIATIGLSQQADNFFWFVSFLLHCELFCLFKTSHSLWASFSGGGQLAFFGVMSPFERLWQKEFPSPHISYFSTENLKHFFEKQGFEQVLDRPLRSAELSGLWQRVRYDQTKGMLYSIFSYLILLALLPFLRVLPSDIQLQFFKLKDSKNSN